MADKQQEQQQKSPAASEVQAEVEAVDTEGKDTGRESASQKTAAATTAAAAAPELVQVQVNDDDTTRDLLRQIRDLLVQQQAAITSLTSAQQSEQKDEAEKTDGKQRSKALKHAQASAVLEVDGKAPRREVYCRTNIFNIEEIDVKKTLATLTYYFEASWHMPELLVDDEASSGSDDEGASTKTGESGAGETKRRRLLTADEVDWKTVWRPKIVFRNTYGSLEETNPAWYAVDPKYYEAFGKPMASWRVILRGDLLQHFNLRAFPFDSHKIKITAMSHHTDDVCLLVPNELVRSAASVSDFSISDTWSVSFDPETCVRPEQSIRGAAGSRPVITTIIHARRLPQYWLYNVVALLFFITSSSFTVFFVEVDDLGQRLELLFTLVLTSVAFKLVIAEQLPDLPYLTALDKYAGFSILIEFLFCVHCVIAANIPSDHGKKLDLAIFAGSIAIWILASIPMFSVRVMSLVQRMGQATPVMLLALCGVIVAAIVGASIQV